jgi:hypothetical protein
MKNDSGAIEVLAQTLHEPEDKPGDKGVSLPATASTKRNRAKRRSPAGQSWMVSPRSSIATNCVILRARASEVFAAPIR